LTPAGGHSRAPLGGRRRALGCPTEVRLPVCALLGWHWQQLLCCNALFYVVGPPLCSPLTPAHTFAACLPCRPCCAGRKQKRVQRYEGGPKGERSKYFADDDDTDPQVGVWVGVWVGGWVSRQRLASRAGSICTSCIVALHSHCCPALPHCTALTRSPRPLPPSPADPDDAQKAWQRGGH
jgi:hypothetical protein